MFKQKLYFSILVAFLALVLSGCVAQKAHLKVVDEAKELKKISEKQERSIKNLKEDAEIKKAEAKRLQKLSKDQEQSIKDLKEELAEAKAKTDELENKVNESSRELQIKKQLITSLHDEIKAGQIEVSKPESQIHIRLNESILFASGKARISSDGLKLLSKIGEQLKDIEDKMILVEGHTDNVPISPRLKSIYSSNLELGAARSIAVVNYQINTVGVPRERIAAVSYGPYRPIADNSSEEGRRKNRRVTIVLVNTKALQ